MCLCPFTHAHEQIPGWKPWGRHCCLQGAGNAVFSQHEPLAACHRKEWWCSEQGEYHKSGWGDTYVASGSGPHGESTDKTKSIFKAIKQVPICFSRALAFYPKGGCGPVFFFLCLMFLFTVLVKAEIAITLRLVWDRQTSTPPVTHCTPSFLVHWSFNCVLFTLCLWRDKHVSLILPVNIVL